MQQPLIAEIFDEQALLDFDKETREFLGEPSGLQYVLEPRITAVEVAVSYEKGSLSSASTQRGPVTTSIKTILTVPLTFHPLRKDMPLPAYLEISADLYMESEALAQLNQQRTAKRLPPFSDPKAAVEDSLYQTDPRVSAKRPLNYFCSGTVSKTEIQASTHYGLMVALQDLGLRVNRPHLTVGNGIREVLDHCQRLKAEKGNFPYPVEGALIRVNSLDLQARLTRASGYRRSKVVFRF